MSYSQVNIVLNSDVISSTTDLWNFTLTSQSSAQIILDAEITLYNEDEDVLYKASKQLLILSPGLNISIDPTTVSGITESTNTFKTSGKQIHNHAFITPGNYVVCLSIFNNDPHYELNRSCNSITVVPQPVDTTLIMKGKDMVKGAVQVHGDVEAFSYIDVFTNPNPDIYQHRNSGVYLTPAFTVLDYPLTAYIYYDTDSDFYYQNIPTYQFNFDPAAYQAILEERLSKKLLAITNLDSSKYADAISKIEEYNNLEEIMANPYFQDESKLLDSLNIYEKWLNDSAALALVSSQMDSFTAQADLDLLADSLMSDTSAYYAAYSEKADSLQAIKDSITQRIQQAQSILEKAKSFASITDRKEALEQQFLEDSTLASVKSYYDQYQTLDPDQLTDPAALKDQLKSFDQINKVESFIAGFQALQFGATVPNYSEFSMSGVLLNGFNVKYGVGKFSFVGAAGRINDNSTFFQLDHEQQTFSKLYTAGFEQKVSEKVSYGIYILQSDFSDEDSLSFYNFLESNNALAGKFEFKLLKNKLIANGEMALSYAQNKDALVFDDGTGNGDNGDSFWPVQLFEQKDNFENGSFTDKAGKLTLSTSAFKQKTIISCTSKYVGTGFYTPGNPFLLNDQFSLEGGVDQSLMKNKVSLSAHVIKNQDNLDGLKETTTSYYNMKGGIRLAFPKLPTLSVDYLPNVIINNYDQIQVNTLSANSAYAYMIDKTPCLITVSYINLNTISALNDTSNFQGRYINVMHNIHLHSVNLQTSWNYNESYSYTDKFNFQVFSIGTRYTAIKWLDLFVNLQMTGDENNHYEPGGQVEADFKALKDLSFKTGFYMYPESTIEYMTNIQNISNTSIYLSATYNF